MMKIKAVATVSMLLLLGLAAPRLGHAQTAGQAASGTYKFALADGSTKYAEFDARNQADGSATGSLFFTDDATLVFEDLDGNGDPEAKYDGYSISVQIDGLTVNKNQAVMSGTITDSTVREFIGQRVLLTVEDNGDNTRVPDKLTWGIYKPVQRTWTPSDSERKVDDGVGLTWIATDSERRDDVGIQMPRDETITTQSFPISAYDFVDVVAASGDIVVQP